MTRTQKLLSLPAAAKRLGEPLEQIKAWVDAGLIELSLTPTGLKRVSAETIENLLEITGER